MTDADQSVPRATGPRAGSPPSGPDRPTSLGFDPAADARREAVTTDAPGPIPTIRPPAAPTAVDRLRRNLSTTLVTSLVLPLLTLVSGVISARVLAPSGRGELAAIFTWEQILGWLCSLGLNDALTYLVAKRPHERHRVVATVVFLSPGLGALGFGLGQLVLPLAFRAQSAQTLQLGRIYMAFIVVDIVSALLIGALAGNHDFGFLNVVRLVQPAINTGLIVLLWRLDRLTVTSALVASAIAGLTVLLAVAYRLRLVNGFGRPNVALLGESVGYGLRVQGGLFGSLVNGRLDLLVMPAILAPGEIGLYAVATSVSSVLIAVVDNVSQVVFSAATTLPASERRKLLERAVRVLFLGAVALATPMFIAAPWALTLVYGRAFVHASPSLRLLMPGAVFLTVSGVAESGLRAANRPGRASAAQIVGMGITVVGLALMLRPLGINGAAITSTMSYLSTFMVASWFLWRVDGVRVGAALHPRQLLAEIGELADVARSRLGTRRTRAGAG